LRARHVPIPDYIEALIWFRIAEKKRIPGALYGIGVCLFHGSGTQQSYYEAAKYFKAIASYEILGIKDLKYYLGECYLNGYAFEQDYIMAVKCFNEAANKGDKKACFKLGWCQYLGLGCSKNYADAYANFHIAATNFYEPAYKYFAQCLELGRGCNTRDIKTAMLYYMYSLNGTNDYNRLARMNIPQS